jgi:protein SFI1
MPHNLAKFNPLPPFSHIMQATTAQISHARDTFVLRVAIHKWRSALVRRRERMAQADARVGACIQKAAFVRWQVHLQERRKAAWRADMRVRMQTVRSLRDGALRRDAWARWRQLYQSRLMQQRFAVRLVEGYFERWKDKVRETDAMKERADQLVVAIEGRIVVRSWDSWVRAAELRSAERDVTERVRARVVGEFMEVWRRRMYAGLYFILFECFVDFVSVGMNDKRQMHLIMSP